MLPPPRALLIDFGGVLADVSRRPAAPPELVRRLSELVGGAVPTERITADLTGGHRAHARWRDEVGAGRAPAELSHVRVWDDFVTTGWPPAAREAVRREATPLAYLWARQEWTTRTGIPEALAAASAAGLPMVVVSNTLCGAAHRDFLAGAGLGDLFAAQLYSDEVGVRKPNPEFIRIAADAVGVPVGRCWFVGDSVHRDIDCARRAGAGAAVLMRSSRTDGERPVPGIVPDAVVDDGHGLRMLLDRWSAPPG